MQSGMRETLLLNAMTFLLICYKELFEYVKESGMEITAVIPVRKGSRRVENKNIRDFLGGSLLSRKIEQLKEVKEINKIIVSSDSDEMLTLATQMGVIAKRRPLEYCDEVSRTFNEVVTYIATNEVETEVMMWVPCVCPLVSGNKIREGIELYKKQIKGEIAGDSIVTAKMLKEYIFDEKGPANFSIDNHVPSQRLPDWHSITNGFFIAKRTDMARWGFVYGPQPYLCEVNKYEAIDIDDEFDFAMAEFAVRYLGE